MHTRQAIWFARFCLALRTALACLLVGFTTMYGPPTLKQFVVFPAFSYLTTIMILSSSQDSTLGEVLRGCFHAFYATLQVMVIFLLSLWVIGPAQLNSDSAAAAAVALVAFVVAIPESTSLLGKRIAFGQTLIVYVGVVVYDGRAGVISHPLHVAASTALGAVASLLAMLLPYPRLAYSEMRKTCRLYIDNAWERLNLSVEAVIARDSTAAFALIAQAKSSSLTAAKLLKSIRGLHGGMMWERLNMRFLRQECFETGEKLRDMGFLARGMELALASCNSFPPGMMDEELRDTLQSSRTQMGLKLEQAKRYISFDATLAPDTKEECMEKPLWNVKISSISHEDLPVCFFWYCLELLKGDLPMTGSNECITKANTEEPSDSKRIWALFHRFTGDRLVFALKCSISLGLAVLFGLVYNKENGYWSGLIVAISFVTGRQATFTVANARAQGTAMGSVYGVLCSSVFQRLEDFRFLTLVPWIIFTNFLRHSRMYGQAGGISAVIGALLLLGRKNYGTPSEFAIARTVEASIGLLCFIFVEILFNPARASTLAKIELSHCLDALSDCIKCLVLCSEQKESDSILTDLRKKERKLRYHIEHLENFIAEAETEPSFWFRPFNVACYNKLLGSLSKIADLNLFLCHEIGYLSQVPETLRFTREELQEHMIHDLMVYKKKVDCSVKCLKEFILTNFLLQKREKCHDIEARKPSNDHLSADLLCLNEEDVDKFLSSFLQLLKEAANRTNSSNCEEKLKSHMVLCLSGLGFCIGKMMREITETKTGLTELVK